MLPPTRSVWGRAVRLEELHVEAEAVDPVRTLQQDLHPKGCDSVASTGGRELQPRAGIPATPPASAMPVKSHRDVDLRWARARLHPVPPSVRRHCPGCAGCQRVCGRASVQHGVRKCILRHRETYRVGGAATGTSTTIHIMIAMRTGCRDNSCVRGVKAPNALCFPTSAEPITAEVASLRLPRPDAAHRLGSITVRL